MQTVQQKTLVDRAASVVRIGGRGICCSCGGEVFEVLIYRSGGFDSVCSSGTCRQVWSPIGKGSSSVSFITQTVDSRRDEPGNMVSKKEEIE